MIIQRKKYLNMLKNAFQGKRYIKGAPLLTNNINYLFDTFIYLDPVYKYNVLLHI